MSRKLWFRSRNFIQEAIEQSGSETNNNHMEIRSKQTQPKIPKNTVIAGNSKMMDVDPKSSILASARRQLSMEQVERSKQLVGQESEMSRTSEAFDKAEPKQEIPIHFFDFNMHAMKKTISSCLLDTALLMANISQLKSVYTAADSHPFYMPMMILLTSSLVMQILIGFSFIFITVKHNINEADEAGHTSVSKLETFVVILVFLLTVVNLIIGGIGISGSPSPARTT